MKKVLMVLERNFKILEDVIDVMAQTKRPVKNTTHPNARAKRFKEMVKALKGKKSKAKVWIPSFLIFRDSSFYSVAKDVGS